MTSKSTPDRIEVFTNHMVVLEQGNMREVTGPWESQQAARNYAQLMSRSTGLRVVTVRRQYLRDDDE